MAEQSGILRQIGIGADGQPLYTYRDMAPVVQAAPRPAPRPYVAYAVAGIGGAVALSALAMTAAVLAIAVSLGAVCLTACLLILRGLWADYQRTQDK